ncbi:adhesion G protein-coupled receptor F5 isoform X4 [Gasterosteus aculeatus]
MAIPSHVIMVMITTALLLTNIILETRCFSSPVLQVHSEEEHSVSPVREKRSVPTNQSDYLIDVVVTAPDLQTFQLLQSLANTSFPIVLDNSTEISEIIVTTVCSPREAGFQCRCEENFAWPYSSCVKYGACGEISGGICKCIDRIPDDGQSCQLMSALLTPVEYTVDVELNVSDIQIVDQLRILLQHGPELLSLGPIVNVTHINITTVCFLNGTNFQCRCEQQYVWSYDNCLTYGACDDIIGGTCGCINSLPTNGQYCQPQTAPPVVYDYLVSIELNTTDVGVRDLLRSISYPISITDTILVSDLNISTVCYPSSAGYQCRCEDQYRWSCDQCFKYGSCDNITDDTCGCISGIPPDGQHCQSADQHNFRVCPNTTTTPKLTTPNTSTEATPTTITTPPVVATTTNTLIGLNVELSVELDRTFNSNLSNPLSDEYKTLESSINKVLVSQYSSITGFIKVSVTGFREGSVITEFTVQTSNINLGEVATANKNLITAITPIAPVIGSVTALINSKTPTKTIKPFPIFTGQTMVHMCEVSPELNIGAISGSKWKFNGKEINTNQVLLSGSTSTLTVNNVALLDIGLYECTLTGGVISYSQKRAVTNGEIKETPIIRLKRRVNVKCGGGGQVISIECCVQSPYTVNWFRGSEDSALVSSAIGGCINYDHRLESCSERPLFTCKVQNLAYEDKTEIIVFTQEVTCTNVQYGDGRDGDESTIKCDAGLEGFKKARCVTRKWTVFEDTCIVTRVKELFFASERLNEETVAEFATNLSTAVGKEKTTILRSPATISATVDVVKNIAAHIGEVVSEDFMRDVLETVDVIIGDGSRESWTTLNGNETRNASSSLLGSMELLAGGLVGEVALATQQILLNRTSFDNSFSADLNPSIFIDIPDINLRNVFITTITFLTLNNVMPVRHNSSSVLDTTGNESRVVDIAVNAAVVLVQINETIQNVTLSYSKLNKLLSQGPQCVFWNFKLFNNRGAWDSEGCKFVSDINNTVTCNCSHLTSFSILMSTNIPSGIGFALDVITYVGVGISMASLVICLIIEGYIWKAMTRNSTSFMRHVSIVNSAVSLLIANICFIIGASIADNPLENRGGDHLVPVGPCSTATFFMHFFYLALFFWMLVSGLLLFYRTVMVFSHMSKSIMLGIGFVLGYGYPLIIAVITVAVTAPGNGYIRKDNACWLNWFQTHALLALVIPALTIVSINLLIVFVVVVKMLRRGVGDAAQADERHTVVVILRCVVILTPLFGLTWALGVGTMIDSTNKGIHIAFAFFNSLQGFFILVFGTLFDSRIRSILLKKSPASSTGSNHTSRTTSGGLSSRSGLNWINRLRRKSNIYHVSEAATSTDTGASESFMNT